MSDRDRLRRRLFGSRSMAGCGARADADRHRAFGHHSTDCSAAYRDQSTTGLSALRQLVCAAISAKRDGAVSRKTLLVAAGLAGHSAGVRSTSPESITTNSEAVCAGGRSLPAGLWLWIP